LDDKKGVKEKKRGEKEGAKEKKEKSGNVEKGCGVVCFLGQNIPFIFCVIFKETKIFHYFVVFS